MDTSFRGHHLSHYTRYPQVSISSPTTPAFRESGFLREKALWLSPWANDRLAPIGTPSLNICALWMSPGERMFCFYYFSARFILIHVKQ